MASFFHSGCVRGESHGKQLQVWPLLIGELVPIQELQPHDIVTSPNAQM